jgi:hypothetical protein
MAINAREAKAGMAVFYQQSHMPRPEYGVISSDPYYSWNYVHVRFNGELHAKACRPEDLHWPPDFCAADRVNVDGQLFSGSGDAK